LAEKYIYKLLRRSEWEAASAAGIYEGSADDRRDGYIHFSAAAQLLGTAKKYFSGVANLLLLKIDAERLPASELRWEPARGGELFPHLYGKLPASAVIEAIELTLDDNGLPLLPREALA
jgi:uncharacterized protein (DUF952 family)